MSELTFELEEGGRCLKVRVRACAGFLEVMPEGHGEKCALEGGGAPVVIDYHAGVLKVHVFGDINSEEPTDTISLEGAREEMRRGA